MSRQAINYLLIQLEELDYIERRSPEGGDRRLIYLSARGWQLVETIFTCLRRLHPEWAQEIGEERFDDFLDVLKQLAARARQDRS